MKRSTFILTIFIGCILLIGHPFSTDAQQPNQSCTASESVNQLKNRLQDDGYTVEHTLRTDSLTFERYSDDLAVLDRMAFHHSRLYIFRCTRSYPDHDGLYPRFKIQEICFSDANAAKEAHARLTEIISADDMINTKIYDRAILQNDRVIYISAVAKAFERYIEQYGSMESTHLAP